MMKETHGLDIFDQIIKAAAICIPTNCSLGQDGCNPMGALAGAAANRWPTIPAIYGRLLTMLPNVPVILGWIEPDPDSNWINKTDEYYFSSTFDNVLYRTGWTALVAYPTMNNIGEPASFDLVMRSANLLKEMADLFGWGSIYLGSPGTGVGGLSVDVVHPALKEIFDDRFTVMQK